MARGKAKKKTRKRNSPRKTTNPESADARKAAAAEKSAAVTAGGPTTTVDPAIGEGVSIKSGEQDSTKTATVPTELATKTAAGGTELKKEPPALMAIWTRRERFRHLAIDAMKRGDFEQATSFFESCLSESESYPLPTDNTARHQMVVCRLRGRNQEENLWKCVEECDYLLENKSEKTVTTPGLVKPELAPADPFQFHEGKCDALLRLLQYERCAKQLCKAVEQDQHERTDSLHLFLNTIAKSTKLRSKKQKAENPFTFPLPKKQLKNFFSLLTAPSRQAVLSLPWEKIHRTIDSEMCDSMLSGFDAAHAAKSGGGPGIGRDRLKKFFHKALDANLKSRKLHNEIFFLKQEIAILITQNLWEQFPVPEMPPEGTKDIESVFQSLPMETPLTYLMENGVYMSRDGLEFVSSALVEGITHLTSLLECSMDKEDPSLVVSLQYLTDVGFNVLAEICGEGFVDFTALGPDSPLWTISDAEWDQFIETRLWAHEVLEVKAAENLVPPQEANEDPKIFENKLEAVVGKAKKEELMKIELKTSLPILKKYARLMSEISGIDYETLVKELTEPDEDTDLDSENGDASESKNADEKPEGTTDSKDKKEEKKDEYVPVGLSVLIQSAEFDLKPFGKDDGYDKEKILKELTQLEKDVVQFQIDYRKKVFEVAGANADKLKDVMSNLQLKGMQLTKWLRGFVKYMIDRRDVEQEILDHSGLPTVKAAMSRFDELTKALSTGQALLLRLICRAMMWNLVQARMTFTCDDLKPPEIDPLSIGLKPPQAAAVQAEAARSAPKDDKAEAGEGSSPEEVVSAPGTPPELAKAGEVAPGPKPELEIPITTPRTADEETRKTTPSTPENSRDHQEETTDEEHAVEEHNSSPPGGNNRDVDPSELSSELTSLPPLELAVGRKIELTAQCLKQALQEMITLRNVVEPAMESFRTQGMDKEFCPKPTPPASAPAVTASEGSDSATSSSAAGESSEGPATATAATSTTVATTTSPSSVDPKPNLLKNKVRKWMSTWSHSEGMAEKIAKLKETLGVSKLSVSYLELNVSIRSIVTFGGSAATSRASRFVQSQMWKGHPHYKSQTNELLKLSLLLDRNSRETIFHLVVSLVDKQIALIPSKSKSNGSRGVTVHSLCHHCGKLFGSLLCSACGSAHYCGKTCQVADWKRHGSPCKRMTQFWKGLQIFTL